MAPSTETYYTASSTTGQVPLAAYKDKSSAYYTPTYAPAYAPDAAYQSSMASAASSYAPSTVGSSRSGSRGGKVDLTALLTQQFEGAFDTTGLDKSLAAQAKSSGTLHAKQQELHELRQQAAKRLARMKVNASEGMKAAREAQRDLEWTQDRVSSMKQRAERDYAEEYAAAQSKYANHYNAY